MEQLGLKNLVIPIRPTFKNKHPEMAMKDYMTMKKDGHIYDPWIRTHVKGGAEIIKVCSKSMNVKGDINFWGDLLQTKVESSGSYNVTGALSLVQIDLEKNIGEYREENIWIKY